MRAESSFLPVIVLVILLTGSFSFASLFGSEKRILTHVGVEREYRLHLPKEKADRPLPLVVALHGAMMNGEMMSGLTRFSRLSDRTGEFAVVYPSADPKGGFGIWDFFSSPLPEKEQAEGRIAAGKDDMGFILGLIDCLVEEGVADRKRIYLAGMSNGSFFSSRLAMDFPDRFAAIGLVAGTTPKFDTDSARIASPLPVIYLHGSADRIVGIDGSDFLTRRKVSLSAREYCEWWAAQNGLPAAIPEIEELPDRDPDDACRIERLTWPSRTAPVIFYRIEGGGHTWPGGPDSQPTDLLGPITGDIDASEVLWQFFARFSRE